MNTTTDTATTTRPAESLEAALTRRSERDALLASCPALADLAAWADRYDWRG